MVTDLAVVSALAILVGVLLDIVAEVFEEETWPHRTLKTSSASIFGMAAMGVLVMAGVFG